MSLNWQSLTIIRQQLIEELEENREYRVSNSTHTLQIVQVYKGTEFAVFGLPVKWLVYLFKQVIVLLSVTRIGFIIHKLFFTTLHPGLRLIVVFLDIMHVEQITQHYVHIALASMCMSILFIIDPTTTAETYAAWNAVFFGRDLGIRDVIMEGDALKIVHAF
jgi:hypothetical protein